MSKWCTASENNKHAYDTNLNSRKGSFHNNSILKDSDIIEIRRLWNKGTYKQIDIAKKFNVSRSHIKDIVNNRRWKHLK